jgi:EAL domain-containing protein (putative c-di-GMP-specific phosphodiesterase class I)
MHHCQLCSTLPDQLPEGGILCIALPIAHTVTVVRKFLDQNDLLGSEPVAGILTIPLTTGVLPRLAKGLRTIMTLAELRDTRALILGQGISPSLADLATMQPLATLFARTEGEWFTALLRDNRLTSHFQPIVHAGEPGRVFAHECLLRGVNSEGNLISPARLYEAARDANLMFALDRAARLTAISQAVLHGLDERSSRLFINFNPTSIYNPVFCLRSTIAAIEKTKLSPDRIVFEIVESDEVDDIDHLVRIAEFYRDAGFRVALDDLGSGFGSLNLLSRIKPDFIKLDMQLIRQVDEDPYKAGIVSKILEMAQTLGVATVAEGIETTAEYRWLLDHGADYMQGYLFARPESPPPRLRPLDLSVVLTDHES